MAFRLFVIMPHFLLLFFFVCCIIKIKKRGDEMNERLKQLRKELNLTQQEFADKLGTARNNIAGYETGKRNPSDAAISLICTKYNVNENWLRTGEGDMFVKLSYSDEIAQFVGQLMTEEDDSFKKRLVSGLAALDETGWKVLEDFLDSIQMKKD
ncbi:helix-turn-helix domain-containing protein [Mediterraneibacter faecis]|uniref:helix-turn-helix domain-containing protein n=1 Tax=Mediterraneibacter faecis TaxID=592978 RepID=UPI003F89F69B